MAGVNFAIGEGLSKPVFDEAAKECASKIAGYSYSRLIEKEGLIAFNVSYEEYPITVVESDNATIILEGHIYNATDYSKVARTIGEKIQAKEREEISDWLGQQDGDFNLYYFPEDSTEVIVVSDALGRVPVFYTNAASATICGRLIHFIKTAIEQSGEHLSLDQEAIAQTLLLRHPLGRKTHFKEISKTGPGAFLRLRPGQVEYSKIYDLRLDNRRYSQRSIGENASNLAERLLRTCEQRSELDGNHIVSLSGGKDSRLVATALCESGCDLSATSYYNRTRWARKDTDIAKQTAERLGINWSLYPVENTGRKMEELLYRKGGLNNFMLGFLVDFYEKVESDQTVQFYTGDVGDLVDGAWSVNREFTSIDDATDWMIKNNAEIPLKKVSDLTGMEEATIRDSVRERLAEFPESEIRAKVEHFSMRERGMNLNFHAEDRTRSFFWTHAPLNSRPVLEYLIECPRDQKANYKLYRKVMKEIRGDLFDVDYAPYGAPVGSKEQLVKEKLYNRISNNTYIRNLVLGSVLDRKGYSESVAAVIRTQIQNHDGLSAYFDSDELENFSNQTENQRANTAYDIITITTLFEYINNHDLAILSQRSSRFN